MKKLFALLLAAVMMMGIVSVHAEGMNVAMITDYGDITDQSFNQTTYEACKAFCEANKIDFTYYKPAGDSTADRVAMVDTAVADGYNVIVMPGFAFAGTIVQAAPNYKDVKFRQHPTIRMLSSSLLMYLKEISLQRQSEHLMTTIPTTGSFQTILI